MCYLEQVFSRLAPFERGIYEDYVANFWCASSILIKWKKLFTTKSLKLLSLMATVLTSLPSMTQQIKYPSNIGFLYGLLNSSISFYLFSFQGLYSIALFYRKFRLFLQGNHIIPSVFSQHTLLPSWAKVLLQNWYDNMCWSTSLNIGLLLRHWIPIKINCKSLLSLILTDWH